MGAREPARFSRPERTFVLARVRGPLGLGGVRSDCEIDEATTMAVALRSRWSAAVGRWECGETTTGLHGFRVRRPQGRPTTLWDILGRSGLSWPKTAPTEESELGVPLRTTRALHSKDMPRRGRDAAIPAIPMSILDISGRFFLNL